MQIRVQSLIHKRVATSTPIIAARKDVLKGGGKSENTRAVITSTALVDCYQRW